MNSYALITGASKGIGRQIAIELAARKYNLLLVARSGELLEKLASEITAEYNVEVKTKALDLTANDADEQILSWITQNNSGLTILVNNAGYGLWGAFEKIPVSQQLNMLELNNTLPVKLTYKLLPLLKKQSRSYILNVASTTAYQALPYLAVYAASKSFMVSFSRALRLELKDTGIVVSCLSPGGTETSFMERAGMDGKKLQDAAAKFSMQASDVARYAIKQLFKEKAEIIPGSVNQLTYVLAKFLPKGIIEGAAHKLYKP